jgi:hypothetical protein
MLLISQIGLLLTISASLGSFKRLIAVISLTAKVTLLRVPVRVDTVLTPLATRIVEVSKPRRIPGLRLRKLFVGVLRTRGVLFL